MGLIQLRKDQTRHLGINQGIFAVIIRRNWIQAAWNGGRLTAFIFDGIFQVFDEALVIFRESVTPAIRILERNIVKIN